MGSHNASEAAVDNGIGAAPRGCKPERVGGVIQPGTIKLPKGFQPKEGVKLTDDLVVGKTLGEGLQGGVYELKDPEGNLTMKVLKIVHSLAPLADIKREWEVGRRLHSLAEPRRKLTGFCGVGRGVQTRRKGKFKGMILERLDGVTIDNVLLDPNFNDVHYIKRMLLTVFTTLDAAQRAWGFHHRDFRLGNVMEVKKPDPSLMRLSKIMEPANCVPDSPRTASQAAGVPAEGGSSASTPAEMRPERTTELTDRAPSVIHPVDNHPQLQGPFLPDLSTDAGVPRSVSAAARKSGKEISATPEVISEELLRQGSSDVPREREPVNNCDTMPHLQFKIIDYGLATFDADYPMLAERGPGMDDDENSPQEESQEDRDDKVKGNGCTFQSPIDLKKLHILSLPKVSLLERIYRCAWDMGHKGDVFHLMRDLAHAIDGQVWPRRDERAVRRLLALINHVTGVRCRAWFADVPLYGAADVQRTKEEKKKKKADKGQNKVKPDPARKTMEQVSGDGRTSLKKPKLPLCAKWPLGSYTRKAGTMHWARTASIMVHSWFRPTNPGLTAAEALTAPFFNVNDGPKC